MEEVILWIGCAVVLVAVVTLVVNWKRKHKEDWKEKEERDRYFLMISHCCMLLELLHGQAFSTPTDFLFLKHRIFMYLKGLYFLPSNKSTPENHQLILATASYCISVLGNWHVKAGGNEMKMKPAHVLALVMRFAVSEFAGISEREEMLQKEDREWVYYMWLTSAFVRVVCSDDETDRRSLGIMCNRIEKYMDDMDSIYLKEKIRECREWMAERKI